jgi:predicted O-linked N-acetylglucosamine transferase (SPINDLY family)
MARWAQAFVALKPVFSRGEDPAAARRDFGEALDELDRWFSGPAMNGAHEAVASRRPFYLSYHEADNRPLLSKCGALCCRLMRHWQQAQGIRPAAPSTAGRVRVGIVSSNICAHSVWDALVKGIVMHLDPGRFELHVFHLGTTQDSETELAQAKAASFVRGQRSLADWTAAITRCGPEVLIYPEVGMHALTSQLASLRLAPVQAAMWGHPETTGLPTIDYFISGDGLEPEVAQAFYTERLVRLPHLGCHYTRKPATQGAAGGDLPDLPGGGPLFVCPGTSFKYMPGHDWVYAEIARRLGSGRFVFFSQQPQWTGVLAERLRAAFSAVGLDASEHLVFLSWLPRPRFHGLMRRADVFLDTIGFSGFNTAMQAVECGLPIVSRRGRFMRGRLAAAILDRMGMGELVSRTDEDYVQLAVRLARDLPYRQRVRQELLQRQQLLFDDLEPIRALERFLIGACRPVTTNTPREAVSPSPAAPEATRGSGVH